MSCSNCFNGCAEIVSDKCVKYTGVNIPELDIENGDPLLVVENKVIEKLLEMMTGDGIIPKIDPADLCPLVSSFLPCCDATTITLNDVISALIKSICVLNGRLTIVEGKVAVIEVKLTALEANYVIHCLDGVSPNSGTHLIVQSIIDELCALEVSLPTTYVSYTQLPILIQQYLDSLPIVNKNYGKMIPNIAYAYFGSVIDFGITGAGTGDWEKVYLCNGQNGTPDLRGVTLVGATIGGSMATAVAPSPGGVPNPNYVVGNILYGNNQAFIANITQMPPHTHAATLTINDPGHIHTVTGSGTDSGNQGTFFITSAFEANGPKIIASALTGLKGNGNDPLNPNVVVTNSTIGGIAGTAAGHPNIQPSKATNYIMYLP